MAFVLKLLLRIRLIIIIIIRTCKDYCSPYIYWSPGPVNARTLCDWHYAVQYTTFSGIEVGSSHSPLQCQIPRPTRLLIHLPNKCACTPCILAPLLWDRTWRRHGRRWLVRSIWIWANTKDNANSERQWQSSCGQGGWSPRRGPPFKDSLIKSHTHHQCMQPKVYCCYWYGH